ncbi:hypothetical protein [Dyella sp.]|uniref:hypothetical protein n=1 Tax=Dyella sp. TaxID=1869338 RepID=UPI003F808C1C
MSGYPMKPQVSREPNGNINVFVGGAYQCLPHEKAMVLLQQLAEALRLPFTEGIAQFAGRVLVAHRPPGQPDMVSDVDGGTLQELALECGLIEPFVCPLNGCCEVCVCEADDRCYRLSAVGRSVVELAESTEVGA